LCCDVELVSELRLTAGCVLMDLASPAVSQTSVYASGLSQARTFEWFKHFKDGRESVEDHKHSGRPSTCTTPEMTAKVCEVILEDRLSTMFVITLDCRTGHVNAF